MATMTYRCVRAPIGQGGSATVYKAIAEPSGAAIALKKSRVSLRIQRTLLHHEARVMCILRGHPAIPTLVGYRRVAHFEYLGMELLGKNLKATIESGCPLNWATVARIGEQMLAALGHLYKHGLVHRDIKPENILTCPSNPAQVYLVDFGIARHLGTDMGTAPRKLYNPIKDNKTIMGTLYWCSLNSHSGYELRPSDDLESLGYSLFFLLLGDMPWKRYTRAEPVKHAMVRIDTAKRSFNDALPISGLPSEFSDLLSRARMSTETDFALSLASIHCALENLATVLGARQGVPLDWTPILAVIQQPDVHSAKFASGSNHQEDWCGDDEDSDEDSDEDYPCSYLGYDFDDWDNIQRERDSTLTFPTHDMELLDGQIPGLGIVLDEFEDML